MAALGEGGLSYTVQKVQQPPFLRLANACSAWSFTPMLPAQAPGGGQGPSFQANFLKRSWFSVC